MHSFDWDDVRYFLAVRRSGTLAGAARALSVRHSTVSRRISALEEALGVALFIRTADGFVMTDAGAGIIPMAEEAERALAAVGRRVGSSSGRIEGVVRVSTSEAFSGFLVRQMPKLQERHPGLVVDVLSSNQRVNLARGEAELALRSMTTEEPDVICRRLCDVGWSLYAAEAYVNRAGGLRGLSLAGHDVIGFDAMLKSAPGAVWLDQHCEGARVVLRCNSLIAALNATIVGLGICSVPCFLGDAEPTLRRLTDAVVGARGVWIVYHPDVGKVGRVRAVIDFIAEIIGSEAARLRGDLPLAAAGPRRTA